MPTADDFKAKGNEAFKNKEFVKAAKIYRDAIALDPKSAVLYSNRAQCFLNMNDWSRAYRDTEAGLLLNPSGNIREKLLYRRGLAAKQIGEMEVASKSFEEVVQLDPLNRYAREELHKLLHLSRHKKPKSSDEVQIPLEVVDQLPPPFLNIAHDKEKVVTGDIDRPLANEVNSTIQELFGRQETKKESPTSRIAAVNFNEMPSMRHLKSLVNIPKEKKVEAYNLVNDMDNSTFKEMFSSTGVEPDFFDFYVESSLFALNNGGKPIAQILSTFQLFQSFPRFYIAVSMCPSSLISGLLAAVSRNLPKHGAAFQKLLSQ